MSPIDRLTDEQWDLVFKARERWRAVGLRTDPADRDTAERVVRGFYGRVGAGEPAIYWADSPASACLMAPLIAAASGLRDQLTDQLTDQPWGRLWDQLRRQLRGQLWDQLQGQIWGQLSGELSCQLSGQLRGQLRGQLQYQLWEQLWEQLRDQLSGQFRVQLRGQLRDQLSGQLSDQLSDQLRRQLRVELAGQLSGQLWDQLSGQLSEQILDQLSGELSGELYGQLRRQLWRQVWDQLSDQLSGQLSGQLWEQLRGQLSDQLSGVLSYQLRGQLSGQLRGQLSGPLWERLRGQLQGQLWNQFYDQLSDQLWRQIWEQLWDQLSGQLAEHARPVLGAWMCGSEWSYWIGHYVTVRDVVGVQYGREQSELLDEWSALAHSCGWWFPFEDFAILCERPDRLSFDERAQLHSADGPAIRYRDGYSVYAWHGQRVPADWIEDPTSITPDVVFGWEDLDQRQAAADILGWDRLLRAVDARMVDRDPDPEIGVLYECDLPDAPASKVLRVRCGTGRTFGTPVPNHIASASEAQEWMWGRHDYAPEVRT